MGVPRRPETVRSGHGTMRKEELTLTENSEATTVTDSAGSDYRKSKLPHLYVNRNVIFINP